MSLNTAVGRIEAFKKDYEDGYIVTNFIESQYGYIFKAMVFDKQKNVLSTAHAMEEVGQNTFCKDFETCETKAISRALAILGYNEGTIATEEDINKADIRKKKVVVEQSVKKSTKAGIMEAPRDLTDARTVSIILKKNKEKKTLKLLAKEHNYKSVEEMCKLMPTEQVLSYK